MTALEIVPAQLARQLAGPQLWSLHALARLGIEVVCLQPYGDCVNEWIIVLKAVAGHQPIEFESIDQEGWQTSWRDIYREIRRGLSRV